MSLGEWRDHEDVVEPTDDESPAVDVDLVTGEVLDRSGDQTLAREGNDESAGQSRESEEVREARSRLAASEKAAAEAEDAFDVAQDALDDAQGAVVVAMARRDALNALVDDAGDATWEQVEAHERVESAQRARNRARTAAARRHDELQATTKQVERSRAAVEAAIATAAEDGDDDAPTLYFGSVDEFVREMIVPVFRRRAGERGNAVRWAARWWEHPEAVQRLEALWRAWEFLRLDPNTGMSVWFRDHADHHLGVLFAEDGPFAKARETTEHGEPLPYEAPPLGLFPDVRRTASDRVDGGRQ